ncbi:uncharacterized protein MONBRDRAFT_26977 [Monosiga brevicollis MX1]|uniref:C-type lectin domain-containing protein n=1 Tax=Monosiga brevicollis TaxID=81824 RepID=A9V3H4_MONBE|nr:uncharacterized protein MONBRDRAFT_26977 [Monosiga brevicollis MX1]EDQ87814.1 predicted protein [Monosiga brevicollis MX1]|eukprot:XP_001747347.1 hypothetical protein [Monosiga brevicollis MX1]
MARNCLWLGTLALALTPIQGLVPVWKRFPGGARYEYGLDPVVQDWVEAGRSCIEQGGSLASIHSLAQNDWIFQALLDGDASDMAWLGGYDNFGPDILPTEDREFHWLDGSPFDFSIWQPSEERQNRRQPVIAMGSSHEVQGPRPDEAVCNLLQLMRLTRKVAGMIFRLEPTDEASASANVSDPLCPFSFAMCDVLDQCLGIYTDCRDGVRSFVSGGQDQARRCC